MGMRRSTPVALRCHDQIRKCDRSLESTFLTPSTIPLSGVFKLARCWARWEERRRQLKVTNDVVGACLLTINILVTALLAPASPFSSKSVAIAVRPGRPSQSQTLSHVKSVRETDSVGPYQRNLGHSKLYFYFWFYDFPATNTIYAGSTSAAQIAMKM